MKKNEYLQILAKSLGLGVLVSTVTYLFERDYIHGWPVAYYINDGGGCEGSICRVPLEKFYILDFINNGLVWITVFVVVLVLIKKFKKN
jgi:uncharacterized membrane protein